MVHWLHRSLIPLFAALVCLSLQASRVFAQTQTATNAASLSPPVARSVEERIRQLEQNQAALVEQNRQLSRRLQILTDTEPVPVPPPPASPTVIQRLPVSSADPPQAANESGKPNTDVGTISPYAFPTDAASDQKSQEDYEPASDNSETRLIEFRTLFDNGLVIRAKDPNESPFELRFRSQNQIRYAAFARDLPTWTDNAGNVLPVNDRSAFELPRGRLIFSGYALRPELMYDLNIDYNTVSRSQINFRSYWLGWKFDRTLSVFAGQNKVPGSREWLFSAMQTLGIDRSMATTFFRPSLSQGIWITGEPADGVFYHAMMSNGFNTLGSTPSQLNSKMTFSGSIWNDPLGDFGSGYGDFQFHEEAVVRYGTSLTYAPIRGPQGSPDAPENSEVRLTDGTLITQVGALAPGVTLTNYSIGLAAFDFAYKHRGFSFSTELYLQELFMLRGTGELPQSSVFQYGGFAQAGYFIVPKEFEVYARTSQVTGPYGPGSEYAGGCNYFFLPNKQNLRWTLDVAWLDHSPADQNRTDYQAGQTGWLLRTQIQMFF